MASNPPSACCTIGVKHEGTAVGEMKIGNYRAYFSYPKNKSTQNAVLFLVDNLGIDFINSQLKADQFAANGYFVVMPDIVLGDPAPLNPPADWDVYSWVAQHTPEVTDPVVDAAIREMRGPLGCKSVAAVGYCFGGKWVCRFLKAGMLDVGFVAHPSLVTEEELGGIQGPLSIAAAKTDPVFTVDLRHRPEAILGEKDVPWQICLYSDVAHGFAVRGDPSQKRQRFAKEQAFLQAVHWFDEYLEKA